MIAVNDIERSLTNLHGNVDNPLDAALIHDGEHIFGAHRVKMVVIIDDRETRLFDPGG